MLTKEEIDFLYSCSESSMMESIVKKGVTIPAVLFTIAGGSYSRCAASAPVEIIIEDMDSIKKGDELFVANPLCSDQESFEKIIKEAYHNVTLSHVKEAGVPTEVRIFIHDAEDLYPYCVMIDKEMIATFKTFVEAAVFVSDIGNAVK